MFIFCLKTQTNTITMPVRFYLYPVPNKKNEFPIRVSISIGKSRYMTGIGYNCTKDAREDSQEVRQDTPKAVLPKSSTPAYPSSNPTFQNMK